MAITIGQAQSLVAALTPLIAKYIKQNAKVLPWVMRSHMSSVVNVGGTITADATDQTGAPVSGTAADLTASSASLPVARLLASSTFLDHTAKTLAVAQGKVVDAAICTLVSGGGFNINAPSGAAGTNITDAVFLAGVQKVWKYTKESGEPVFAVLDTGLSTTPGQHDDAYMDILALANAIDTTKVGTSVVTARYVKYKVPQYYGVYLIPCDQVVGIGSSPTTTWNFICSKTALALATCQRTVTNDASNVQAMSEDTDFGTHVGLAFDGSDNQTVTITTRSVGIVARAAYGVSLKS